MGIFRRKTSCRFCSRLNSLRCGVQLRIVSFMLGIYTTLSNRSTRASMLSNMRLWRLLMRMLRAMAGCRNDKPSP